VIHTLLVSHTELIANRDAAADPVKRHAMEQLRSLLLGTLEARTKVLVKLNVPADRLDDVLALLPSMRSPTIAELSGGVGFALETVVAKAEINILIPALKDAGASDLLEIPLAKIIH
jgi:ATP phosphoribosyltransferase